MNPAVKIALRYLSSVLKNKSDIMTLRAELSETAQKVYNGWDEDYAEELGGGGICQDIAEAFVEVLDKHGIEAGTVSASVGEQHVYAVAKTEDGVFEVNISPYIYESGSGYNWKKKLNVKFTPENVTVSLLYKDPEKYEDCIDDQSA
jgi:hypothetical protein